MWRSACYECCAWESPTASRLVKADTALEQNRFQPGFSAGVVFGAGGASVLFAAILVFKRQGAINMM
jgi:hypothetical protein